MAGFLPEGLTRKQAGILAECNKGIPDTPLTEILKQAERKAGHIRLDRIPSRTSTFDEGIKFSLRMEDRQLNDC